MKLDKAIEITKDLLANGSYYQPDDRKDAAKLLIEAGKREEYHRSSNPNKSPNLLPGETED